jgi:iron complex outermembrane receptor protein
MLHKWSYFCAMKWVLVYFTFLAALCPFVLSAQISGQVLDEEKNPLPGATILLLPDSIGQVSDINGLFSFPGDYLGTHRLQVSFIGFETQEKIVRIEKKEAVNVLIELLPKEEFLEEVVITEEHAKQESTLHAEHISEHFMEENLQGTFAKSIEQLPGINAINVGVGIAKPVIRGLSSNRIIVNQQGIKQESHQWGADHGLEIDQFDVERVEIIKGPASLQYGSDGLGGVINVMPGRIIPRNSIAGSVRGVYKTNNQHIGGSAHLAANVDDFFIAGRFSRQEFADYRVPASQFEYNGFVLPILNQSLKNTAGQEQNVRVSAGLKRKWGITRLLFGHYSLDAGLFSGAVGIPRSYALTDDGNSRDIDVPKQAVDHYRLSFHQTLFFGPDHLDINIGYQRNLRREFSFPEFHSIPSSQIDPGNTLALQLELQTLSANLHYERRHSSRRKLVLGANVQRQQNVRGGFEFLLPSFQTFRTGAFALSEWNLSSDWIVNGGVRLDYATNDTEFFRQWVWDSNENITDSLVAPLTDDAFFNWSASVGSSLTLQEGRYILKANLGKSFRVPYPAETVSNGIHHGTFRHEVGTANLQSEQGYQADLSLDFDFPRFSGGLSAYFNFFDNYIYLGPTAQFSPLPEAGQIFQYRQDDAFYTGFEVEWQWELFSFLELRQAADFVQSYNLNTGLGLPFTPQPALKHYLRYSLDRDNWLDNLFVEVGYEYFFAAEGRLRIDRTENPTPAYQLWQVGTGLRIHWWDQPLQLNVQVQNLLNTSYLNHLSRYRLINVPEQGRNFVLSLKVPFGASLPR